MPDETRIKFCPGCSAEIQWSATACNACGKAQPAAVSKPTAPPRQPQPPDVPPGVAMPGPRAPMSARDGAAAFAWVVSLIGTIGCWAGMWSTRPAFIGGEYVTLPLLNAGAVRGLIVFGFLFLASTAFWVIRSAVASALRVERSEG